jgi:hypothetical protein
MDETGVFAVQTGDVPVKAIEDDVARVKPTWQKVYDRAMADIKSSRMDWPTLPRWRGAGVAAIFDSREGIPAWK